MSIRPIRKDRTDRATGETIYGPVHLIEDEGFGSLTLCGKRLKGFGVVQGEAAEVTGDDCIRCAINRRDGRRDAWKSR